MIEGFTGLPGMGKTYNMTRMALKQMKKGRKVYANYQVEGAEYFKELSDIVNVKNALILIDEAGIYLPSQAFKDIPFEFIRQIRQHRHDGLDMWYTAQDMMDVATYLRRITQMVHDFNRLGPIMTERVFNPRTKSKYGFGVYLLDKKVYTKYDTTENVDLAEFMLNKIKSKK